MAEEQDPSLVAHAPAVWRTVSRLLGPTSDAEDCVQEVFAEFLRVATHEGIRDPRSMLIKIATRRAIDFVRSRVRHRPTCRIEALSRYASPADEASANEIERLLADALRHLPIDQAKVFCLTQFEQMSYRETAEALAIETSHVGVLLHRARAALRLRLGPKLMPTYVETAKKLQAASAMQWEVGYGEEAQRIFVKGSRVRTEGYTRDGVGSWISIRDLERGEELHISPDGKFASLQRSRLRYHPAEDIRAIAKSGGTLLGVAVRRGRTLLGFATAFPYTQHDGTALASPVHLWVDPDSKLPVEMDFIDVPSGRVAGTRHSMRFDVDLPDSLFEMSAPDGFDFCDLRGRLPHTLRAESECLFARDLLIEPGVGIGGLKLGDTASRAVELLGEPEHPTRVPDASNRADVPDSIELEYRYPSIGLRLQFAASKPIWKERQVNVTRDDLLLTTIFIDGINTMWHSRPFPGRTHDGIGIGATRGAVERSYGLPHEQNTENADYRERGLAVLYNANGTLVDGFLIVKPSARPIFGAGALAPEPPPESTSSFLG